MTEKKTKKKKRAYLDDFEKEADGTYIYKGYLYRYKGNWKENIRGLWIRTGLLIAAVVAAGLVPSAGMMNTAYVILPYTAQMTVSALFAFGVLKLSASGSEVKEYIYQRSYERFRPYLFMLFVLSAMTLAGELIHYAVSPQPQRLLYTVLFCILEAAVFLICLALNRFTQLMSFEKVKNQ